MQSLGRGAIGLLDFMLACYSDLCKSVEWLLMLSSDDWSSVVLLLYRTLLLIFKDEVLINFFLIHDLDFFSFP